VFGGLAQSQGTGYDSRALSRQIVPERYPYSVGPADSHDDDAKAAATDGNLDHADWRNTNGTPPTFYVPFHSATLETANATAIAKNQNSFFGQYDTNEIPFGITRPDGSGYQTFETLTYRESEGLGCADILKSGPNKGHPRSCWLVAVPRGQTDIPESDGTRRQYSDFQSRLLQSSPLTTSAWNDRIVFPLDFQPVGQPCPLNAKQRPVGGVDTSSEAVLRWQPALCANGGTVFSYVKLGDAVVESNLTGPDAGTAGVGFLNAPVSAQVPSDRSLVYAPVAVSGIAVAAQVERSPLKEPDNPEATLEGAAVSGIKLTPRLVAKLLTSSYQSAVGPLIATPQTRPGYIRTNPEGVGKDPDFLALNPAFKHLSGTNVNLDLVIPTGVAYTTSMVWRWIEADQEARDFVAGVPDPWGMRVNPFYQGLDLSSRTFLKIEPQCGHPAKTDPNVQYLPPLCQLDVHPYAQDFFESARNTARGDTKALRWATGTTNEDPRIKPLYAVAPPLPGSRSLLGVTDTALANRFLLPTVELRNAAGRFVAPTVQSMQAAVASMRHTGAPGVTVDDPETASKAAYPLTTVTYAVAAPNQYTAQAAHDYASFVRYAAGPGQTLGTAPGTLPFGYAPLTPAQRRQALTAADQIQARVGPSPASHPRPSSSSGTSGTSGTSAPGPAATTPGSTDGVGTTPTASPTPAATAASPSPSAAPLPSAKTVVQRTRTPNDSPIATVAKYAAIGALLIGMTGVLIAPLLPRIAERFRRGRPA
jgi:preprotein translocase subunit Sss1